MKMSEAFFVARCYSCQMFQVQQTKKSNTWSCKVCGGKQSLKKIYGRGRAIDCRKLVQQLNMEQENNVENDDRLLLFSPSQYEETDEYEKSTRDRHDQTSNYSAALNVGPPNKISKWDSFISFQSETDIDSGDDHDITSGAMPMDNDHYTTDRRMLESRKFNRKNRYPFYKDTHSHSKQYKMTQDQHNNPPDYISHGPEQNSIKKHETLTTDVTGYKGRQVLINQMVSCQDYSPESANDVSPHRPNLDGSSQEKTELSKDIQMPIRTIQTDGKSKWGKYF